MCWLHWVALVLVAGMILVEETGMCSVVLAIGWLVENGSFVLGRGGMPIARSTRNWLSSGVGR